VRIFDTLDWSLVSTYDTRKFVFDLCLSNDDANMTVIEVGLILISLCQNETEAGDLMAMDVNSVRSYAIGYGRDEEEGSVDEEAVDEDTPSLDSDEEDENDEDEDDDDESDSDDDLSVIEGASSISSHCFR